MSTETDYNSTRVLITGGHMTPALAVISELKKRGYHRFVWVGQKYNQIGATNVSPEYQTVARLGNIKFVDLRAGKFVRSWYQGPGQLWLALINLVRVPWGFVKALWIMIRYRPHIIVSFGGFLALPIVIVGKLFRRKVVSHEQTVVTGLANKIIGRFADKVLISWGESAEYYPPHKVILTGNPVREGITKVQTNTIHFIDNLPVIYVTGGNQGAFTINKAVFEALPQLLKVANVIHQTGESIETVTALRNLQISPDLADRYIHKPYFFEEELGEVFNKSHLIISRAGANTITEILYLGIPAILIPIPWVSRNEQYLNGQMVATTGLGAVLPQKSLSAQTLLDLTYGALQNIQQGVGFLGESLTIVKAKAQNLINPNAAARIVDTIEAVLD